MHLRMHLMLQTTHTHHIVPATRNMVGTRKGLVAVSAPKGNSQGSCATHKANRVSRLHCCCICMYMCMCACVCMCMSMCMYMCMCMCMCMCAYVCTRTHDRAREEHVTHDHRNLYLSPPRHLLSLRHLNIVNTNTNDNTYDSTTPTPPQSTTPTSASSQKSKMNKKKSTKTQTITRWC